jgi:Zn finger protein HypA/HybF involved in hydrogenase expression
MPVEQLLLGRRNRSHVKARLLRLGLKASRCDACGIADWLGEPLSLCLHHVNGDRHDNRLENLRLLCPNCHSQTENFSGRNRRAAA